jgi:LacI family transcriptional regulator
MSIQRIAQLAKTPYSTTWRVLNRQPGVSPEVVARVLKVAAQVGYVAGQERRGRPPKTSGLRNRQIGLLHMRQTSPLGMSIIRVVQRLLADQGVNMIFGHVEALEDLPPAVRGGSVDGILGYGAYPASAVTPALQQIPAVWMMSRPDYQPDPWGDRVGPDNQAVGQLAARYLIEQGHKRLAYLNTNPGTPAAEDRGQAFAAVGRGGVESVELLSCERNEATGGVHSDTAIEMLVDRWAAMAERPTGLHVFSDWGVAVVYRRMLELGIRLGQDVVVVSCDHQTELLASLRPAPVSIDLNYEALAHLAVERLWWRMKEGNASPQVRIYVSPSAPEPVVG